MSSSPFIVYLPLFALLVAFLSCFRIRVALDLDPLLDIVPISLALVVYLFRVHPALGMGLLGLVALVLGIVLTIAAEADISAWWVFYYLIVQAALGWFTSFGWCGFLGAVAIIGYLNHGLSVGRLLPVLAGLILLKRMVGTAYWPGALPGYGHGTVVRNPVMSALQELDWSVDLEGLNNAVNALARPLLARSVIVARNITDKLVARFFPAPPTPPPRRNGTRVIATETVRVNRPEVQRPHDNQERHETGRPFFGTPRPAIRYVEAEREATLRRLAFSNEFTIRQLRAQMERDKYYRDARAIAQSQLFEAAIPVSSPVAESAPVVLPPITTAIAESLPVAVRPVLANVNKPLRTVAGSVATRIIKPRAHKPPHVPVSVTSLLPRIVSSGLDVVAPSAFGNGAPVVGFMAPPVSYVESAPEPMEGLELGTEYVPDPMLVDEPESEPDLMLVDECESDRQVDSGPFEGMASTLQQFLEPEQEQAPVIEYHQPIVMATSREVTMLDDWTPAVNLTASPTIPANMTTVSQPSVQGGVMGSNSSSSNTKPEGTNTGMAGSGPWVIPGLQYHLKSNAKPQHKRKQTLAQGPSLTWPKPQPAMPEPTKQTDPEESSTSSKSKGKEVAYFPLAPGPIPTTPPRSASAESDQVMPETPTKDASVPSIDFSAPAPRMAGRRTLRPKSPSKRRTRSQTSNTLQGPPSPTTQGQGSSSAPSTERPAHLTAEALEAELVDLEDEYESEVAELVATGLDDDVARMVVDARIEADEKMKKR
ncbi:hypothetical protein F5Y13DRAFT_188502 [Hypoxylon sp. FL1857]|nr:hypothetical protein F5Y13DRAFT_188502 [Hypoxylon sp. FL1857]